MTGPAWILAAATGFALVYAIGLRARTHAAEVTAPPWPAESDGIELEIPGWVNQGNRAVVGQYEEILAAIHEAAHIELWEHEMGER